MVKGVCFSGECEGNTLLTGRKSYRVELLQVIKEESDGFFVYSPLQSKIYRLTRKEWNFIKKRAEVEGSAENRQLVESGLYPPGKKDGIPRRTDLEEHHSLALFPTTECNAACVYCYADSKEKGKTMDFETAKNAIDYYSKEQPLGEIFFHGGGEPTIALPLIKKIVAYAKKKNPETRIGIQSNGFFPRETARWIAENVDIVSISCDGPPEIQDVQRPLKNGKSSSKIMERNIKFLSAKKRLGVKATFTSKSVNRQEEVLEYVFRLGVKGAEFGPFTESDRSNRNKLSVSLSAFGDGFLKAKEFAEEFGIRLQSEFLPLKARYSLCGFCKPSVAITTDGLISACWETTSKESGPQEFIYGKITSAGPEFDVKALERIRSRTVENMAECKDCPLKWTCAGGCVSHEFKESKNLMQPSKERCKAKKRVVSRYLDYRIEKDFIRIKPFFEEKNGKTVYSIFFNELRVKKAKSLKVLEENPLIEIPVGTDLELLASTVIKHRDKRQFKPTLFFLRFKFEEKNLHLKIGKEVESFFSKLKKNKVHFKLTRPLPKCIFGSDYTGVLEKYSIPRKLEESLDFFTVKDGKIFFGSKHSGLELKNVKSREEIEKRFNKKKSFSPPKTCRECIYLWRKQCGGLVE